LVGADDSPETFINLTFVKHLTHASSQSLRLNFEADKPHKLGFFSISDHFMPRLPCCSAVPTLLFFIFGSGYPVLNSVILVGAYPYRPGLTLQFHKPWFQLTIMFLGMAAFVLPSVIRRGLSPSHPLRVPLSARLFRRASLPALCCLGASAMQTKALMAMPPSVWQAFFGFRLLFATLFASTFRRRGLLLRDWGGLFLCVSGMALSGAAALVRSSGGTGAAADVFAAFLLAILSHALQALQTISEEGLLRDDAVNAATLAAYEGLWGAAVAILVFLPLCAILSPADSFGFYENPVETFELLGKSVKLSLLIVAFFVCVTVYTLCGIVVTRRTSATQRNVCEMARPLGVWAIAAVVNGATKESGIGEPIDRYTVVELAGFLVTIAGVVVYENVGTCKKEKQLIIGHEPLLTTSLVDDVESMQTGDSQGTVC
jgi:drug/metabolite transporter (DMT)-like permease